MAPFLTLVDCSFIFPFFVLWHQVNIGGSGGEEEYQPQGKKFTFRIASRSTVGKPTSATVSQAPTTPYKANMTALAIACSRRRPSQVPTVRGALLKHPQLCYSVRALCMLVTWLLPHALSQLALSVFFQLRCTGNDFWCESLLWMLALGML